MDIEHLKPWLLPGLFVLVGIAALFVRVDRGQLIDKIHTNPGLALWRFKVTRYAVALALFILAAVAYESSR